MNRYFTSLLISLSCLTSSVALAGPAQAKYSTIEAPGHLIPVGDHHLYRYDYLPWNVSISPLFVIGHYGIGIERAVTDYVALRAAGAYHDLVDSNDPAELKVSIGAPIYFRKMHDGFFFEPSVGLDHHWGREDLVYDDAYGTWTEAAAGEKTSVFIGSQIGWRIIWDSGLNVTAAVGMGRRLQADSQDELMGLSRLDIGFSF